MRADPVADILKSLPPTIDALVKQRAQCSPDQLALVEPGGTWTYRQLNSCVEETCHWLRTQGVRPGDRVMIVGENCRAFIAVLLATVHLDAWPVLVNARLSPREVDAIRDHCGPRRVIYTIHCSSHTLQHAERERVRIVQREQLGSIGVGPLDETVETEPIDGEHSNRVAAVIYTSGTTGMPKGVMLTHRSLLFIAKVSAKIRSLNSEDRLYGVLPMSHAVGLSVVLLGTLLSGATLYMSPRFDPMTARVTLENDRITVVLGVPSMFAQFMQYAKLRGLESLRLPHLRIISSSGAPLDIATKRQTEAFFGITLHNGYGITECSPTIAQTRVGSPQIGTSVGELLPGVEAKFMLNGEEVFRGEVGELWVRGPNIMKGYYRDSEATAAAVDAEGWFNTRDLANLRDGQLFIVGRTKDLIVRSGFNVYPIEVETVLNSHPLVVQSAVIGRSVEGDEEILAFVQSAPQVALTSADLSEYAARHLAQYKRPTEIVIMPALPMTTTGKVAKAALAELAATSRYQ